MSTTTAWNCVQTAPRTSSSSGGRCPILPTSGFALEYGWGARTIADTTWQIEHYTTVDSLWGHPQLSDLVTGVAPGEK